MVQEECKVPAINKFTFEGRSWWHKMHFLAAFIMWKIAEENGDEDEEKILILFTRSFGKTPHPVS